MLLHDLPLPGVHPSFHDDRGTKQDSADDCIIPALEVVLWTTAKAEKRDSGKKRERESERERERETNPRERDTQISGCSCWGGSLMGGNGYCAAFV